MEDALFYAMYTVSKPDIIYVYHPTEHNYPLKELLHLLG